MPQQPPPQPRPAYQQPSQQPAPQPYQRTIQPPPRGEDRPYIASASSVEVIEEFEPYEDEEGEEISEEEYEGALRDMRRRRVAGAVGATLLGILAAFIVFMLLVNPSVLPFVESFEPTPLLETDLSAPRVPDWDPGMGEEPPTSSGVTSANTQYVLSWTTSQVFVSRGGTMRVNVTNKGTSEIYVEQVRIYLEWSEPSVYYATTLGRYVDPGEQVHIGLLAFDGPAAPGIYNYHFEVDLMVKRPLLGTWADIPVQAHDTFEIEALSLVNTDPYPIHENDKDVYRKVNDLIRPDDPRVADLADQLRQGLGGDYNVYWIASLFDWVITELEYRSDPSEGDEWAPPGETCDSLAGDCEDYSILIASVVEHWGGNAQFYIISQHAFAGVYIGPATMDVQAVVDALGMYYGTSPYYSWFVDDLGYWIIADGTSGQYLGGLPYGGVATDAQGGWDIDGTEYLYITDIYPGYPE